MNNSEVLNELFGRKAIAVRQGSIFGQIPEPRADVPFSRLEGMVLGLAIGDALGNTSEGLLAGERQRRHGIIRDYLPNRHLGSERVGLPSDDTQMAAWTLEQLIQDVGYVPVHLADRFCSGRIFGIGSTVRQFISNYKDGRQPWHAAGPRSAGNGALMRIAPMIFPHWQQATTALWVDTALSAMTTHNDNASISSCVAFVNMLWNLLAMQEAPPSRWWADSFVAVLHDLNDGTQYRPRGGKHLGFRGTFSSWVNDSLNRVAGSGLSVVDAGEDWYSGAYLLETVPSALYILMKHGHDPEEAIVRAVNDTKDNDTIAAIVGAAVGALYGRDGLPQRWMDGLLGRTRESDDGHLFQLLDNAARVFGPDIR